MPGPGPGTAASTRRPSPAQSQATWTALQALETFGLGEDPGPLPPAQPHHRHRQLPLDGTARVWVPRKLVRVAGWHRHKQAQRRTSVCFTEMSLPVPRPGALPGPQDGVGREGGPPRHSLAPTGAGRGRAVLGWRPRALRTVSSRHQQGGAPRATPVLGACGVGAQWKPNLGVGHLTAGHSRVSSEPHG